MSKCNWDGKFVEDYERVDRSGRDFICEVRFSEEKNMYVIEFKEKDSDRVLGEKM